MDQKTNEKLKDIKKSFRFIMNGPSSQSMREKGLDYKINWGVPFMELKKMAKDYGKDFNLAIELWKEDIRECKILATLIMPADKMDKDLLSVWMETCRNQELVEMLCFNLLQYTDFAPEIAYKWIAGDDALRQIGGYTLLGRLFMNGATPNERGINEFIDQCQAALKSDDSRIRHSAINCAMRFADLGIVYERMAHSALGI